MSSISAIAMKGLKILAALIAPFLAYYAFMSWDIHKVTSLCSDIHPGVSFYSLRELAKRHGIAEHWITQGVRDDKQGSWVFFVPAGSTFGDVACMVHHDSSVVISAKVDGL